MKTFCKIILAGACVVGPLVQAQDVAGPHGLVYGVDIAGDWGMDAGTGFDKVFGVPVAVAGGGGGYTPTTVVFDGSDYTGSLGLTTGDDLIIACRITRTVADAGGDTWILGDTTSNFALRINDTNDFVEVRFENTTGTSAFLVSSTTVAQGETVSIFARARLTDASNAVYELYINATLEDDDTLPVVDPSVRDLKVPLYINTTDGAAANTRGFKLVGGLWIANTGYASLTYSDFFDGSDLPIFDSATVDGITARFFQNRAASDWNAGTNDGADGNFTMNGSVTDE